jgi:hypothetical protein
MAANTIEPCESGGTRGAVHDVGREVAQSGAAIVKRLFTLASTSGPMLWP